MGTAGPRAVACFAVGAALNLLSVRASGFKGFGKLRYFPANFQRQCCPCPAAGFVVMVLSFLHCGPFMFTCAQSVAQAQVGVSVTVQGQTRLAHALGLELFDALQIGIRRLSFAAAAEDLHPTLVARLNISHEKQELQKNAPVGAGCLSTMRC